MRIKDKIMVFVFLLVITIILPFYTEAKSVIIGLQEQGIKLIPNSKGVIINPQTTQINLTKNYFITYKNVTDYYNITNNISNYYNVTNNITNNISNYYNTSELDPVFVSYLSNICLFNQSVSFKNGANITANYVIGKNLCQSNGTGCLGVGTITGLGTAYKIPMWNSTNSINDSILSYVGDKILKLDGLLTGGSSLTANPLYLDLGVNSGLSYATLYYPNGKFIMAQDSVFNTDDIFFQGQSTNGGGTALEDWNGAGLWVGTGATNNPINFYVNRNIMSKAYYNEWRFSNNVTIYGNLSAGNTTIRSLNQNSCDVKATTSGNLYCGTDSGGNEVNNGSIVSLSSSTNDIKFFAPTPNYNRTMNLTLNWNTNFIGWQNLTNYPSGCGAGKSITALGDTPSCTTFLQGTGSSTRIAFWSSSTSLSYNDNLDYDNSNYRMSIGEPVVTSPTTVTSNIFENSRDDGVANLKLGKASANTLNDPNQWTFLMDYYSSGSNVYETISTYTTASNDYSAYYIKADIIAIDDRPDYSSSTIYGFFENSNGAGVNQIGTTTVVSYIDSGSGHQFQFATSGNNINIQGKDDAHRTYWHVVYTVQKISRAVL
jgi:hypothetical protein